MRVWIAAAGVAALLGCGVAGGSGQLDVDLTGVTGADGTVTLSMVMAVEAEGEEASFAIRGGIDTDYDLRDVTPADIGAGTQRSTVGNLEASLHTAGRTESMPMDPVPPEEVEMEPADLEMVRWMLGVGPAGGVRAVGSRWTSTFPRAALELSSIATAGGGAGGLADLIPASEGAVEDEIPVECFLESVAGNVARVRYWTPFIEGNPPDLGNGITVQAFGVHIVGLLEIDTSEHRAIRNTLDMAIVMRASGYESGTRLVMPCAIHMHMEFTPRR